MKTRHSTDLSGLHGSIYDVRVVDGPPSTGGVCGVQPGPDIDLVAMARWALRALRKNPRPNLDHECRFSTVPTWYPPCLGPNDHDPITIGDTDIRRLKSSTTAWDMGTVIVGDARLWRQSASRQRARCARTHRGHEGGGSGWFQKQMAHCLDGCRTGQQPTTGAKEGIEATRIAEAALSAGDRPAIIEL